MNKSPLAPISIYARVFFMALISGFIFIALQPASASESRPGRFVCAARVDCGAPRFPSTQELPTASTPTVVSKSIEDARTKCMSSHTDAYRRLAKSVDDINPHSVLSASRGCKIVSEAFRE